MKLNNDAYGGFIVSQNIVDGKMIRYSYREKSDIPQLNGWTLYSVEDNEEYVNNTKNFVVLSAESIFKIAPVFFEIFNAPYGINLCWMYEDNIHTGFYDLTYDKEISIAEILNSNENK